MNIWADYTFQVVAAGTVLLGIASGVTGSFAVLRKESLTGDALSHAALPGVILAFLFLGTKNLEVLLAGAGVAAIAALAWVAATVRFTKISFDAALATILATFFGAGMVLLTYVQRSENPAQAGLTRFIFGQAATMLARDVYITAGVALFVLALALLFWKELKVVAFDGDFAHSLRIPVRTVNFIYGVMLVASVLIGLESVGAILMSSLLIAPAVAARQWTDSLGRMTLLSGTIGALSCLGGTYWSTAVGRMPTGPAIVVIASLIVMASLLFAPKRGIVARWRLLKRQRRAWKGGDGYGSAL